MSLCVASIYDIHPQRVTHIRHTSRILFLILIVVFLILMVLVAFSIILTGKILGQMFAMLFNNFLNKTGSPWNEQ